MDHVHEPSSFKLARAMPTGRDKETATAGFLLLLYSYAAWEVPFLKYGA